MHQVQHTSSGQALRAHIQILSEGRTAWLLCKELPRLPHRHLLVAVLQAHPEDGSCRGPRPQAELYIQVLIPSGPQAVPQRAPAESCRKESRALMR